MEQNFLNSSRGIDELAVPASCSREDSGAIKAFGILRRLRIHKIQGAVERRIGEPGRPVDQIGRNFNETTRSRLTRERKLEIPVGHGGALEGRRGHYLQHEGSRVVSKLPF